MEMKGTRPFILIAANAMLIRASEMKGTRPFILIAANAMLIHAKNRARRLGGYVYDVLNRGNGQMVVWRKPPDLQAFYDVLMLAM